MAGALQGGKGGGRSRRNSRRRSSPITELNMTPFIDVVLVLLIIFMVAAPLLTVGVPIELPKSSAKPLQEETQPITVSVNVNGEIFIQEQAVSLDDLVTKLSAIAKGGTDERVFIRGDRTTNYGLMMRVMGRISSAGYKKIGLVTEQDEAGGGASTPAGPAGAIPGTPQRRG
ncbi:MAG: biopolymer transporter ExbD [Hyphomicrobiales bacterium]|nr:biopolymer transporter ExbD [Hyphomicrobiales bacterium]OQW83038.1 MAG: protein TolR [Proteobacteria bacterium ST_bin15]